MDRIDCELDQNKRPNMKRPNIKRLNKSPNKDQIKEQMVPK